MPYPAIWTRSQRGQLSADYESVAFPGNTFIFLQKRKTQQFSYFRCAYCAKAMKLRSRRKAEKLTVPIVRATIEDGFLDDPDNPFHRHFCIDEEGVDTSTYAAKARYIYKWAINQSEAGTFGNADDAATSNVLRELGAPNIQKTIKQMEAEVIANFPDQVTQQEIISRLPSDKSAKRSFARRSSVAKKNFAGDLALFSVGDELFDEGVEEEEDAADNDPRSIPLEILKPFSPRPPWICAPGRERLANFFLIYRDPQTNSRPFLVFSDIMGINLLHKCGDIVCDGNSNFYPHGFAQLYTFHAVHPSIPEEAHFAGFALLPNTSPHTYVKLFDVLSERLLSEYGDHGVHKVWHFDNHYAAISGCRAIFTNDVAEGGDQGRTANFAQLWHEHLGSLFYGTHPNLLRFIRVMREELARASIQAERIFKRPMPVRRINLDNVARLNKYPPLLMRRGEFYDDYPTTSIIGRAPGSTGSNGMGHYDYYGPAQPRMVGQCRRRLSARRRAQRQRQAGLNSFAQNRGEGGEESKETAKKANVQKMELQPEEEEEIIQVEDIEENGESAERDNVRQGTVASVEAGKTAERKQSPFVEKQEEECLIDVEEEEPLIVEEIVTDGTHLQLEMEDASETEDLEV